MSESTNGGQVRVAYPDEDIPTRLRNIAQGRNDLPTADSLLTEAADEIERLRAVLHRIKEDHWCSYEEMPGIAKACGVCDV